MGYESYFYVYKWINMAACSNNVRYIIVCELNGHGLSPTGKFLKLFLKLFFCYPLNFIGYRAKFELHLAQNHRIIFLTWTVAFYNPLSSSAICRVLEELLAVHLFLNFQII